MSESAYGGESAWGWDRGFEPYSEPEVRSIMEIISPQSQRRPTTEPQEETPKQSTRVIRGEQQEATPSTTPAQENKTRIIRGPEETEQEEPIYDIGELRKQVMAELYDEFYAEIKHDVREELLKEKPVIVREITDELREKLKADLRKSFIKGEGGGR